MGQSTRIMRELTERHLQSVVGLKVQSSDPSQEGTYSATGSIVTTHSDFMFILTCSHTFKPFTVCHGPGFDSAETVNDNTDLQVSFFDGYVAGGEVFCIDWWKDLCLVIVLYPAKSSYKPVQFIDGEEDMMGQSIYNRGSKVYSIFCFPTNQKEHKLLFGTTVKGEICGRNNLIGDDLDPVYRSDLRFFEFDMAGAMGCSGAPVFSKDFLVMGMRIAKAEDLMFALKLSQIREWAYTWFDMKWARTMNEIVAGAGTCMYRELREIESVDVDIHSLECNIDDLDL